jgi:hypothetical protein
MGAKAPPAPDYKGAAEATAASNQQIARDATQANRYNVVGPQGGYTWTRDPSNPDLWTQNINLSPDQKAAMEAQQAITMGRSGIAQGMVNNVGQTLGTPPDFSSLNPYGQAPTAGQLQSAPQGGAFSFGPGQSNFQNNVQAGAMPDAPQGGQNMPQFNQGAWDQMSNSMYNQAKSRLDPQFQGQAEAARQQAYSMGLREGDPQFDVIVKNQQMGQNDAYNQALQSSIQGGFGAANQMYNSQLAGQGQAFGQQLGSAQLGTQQQGQAFGQGMQNAGMYNQNQQNLYNQGMQSAQLANQNQQTGFNQGLQGAQFNNQNQQVGFNQGMQNATYQNQLRNQQQQDLMTQRGWGLNEMNALLSGQQIGMPGTGMQGGQQQTTAGADLLGAANMQGQYGMQAAQMQNQMLGNIIQGVGSMAGGAASMFSDKRLKRDIVRGKKEVLPGVKEATFRYKGKPGRHKGVIAQDVEKKYPNLVHEDPETGYKKVPAALGPHKPFGFK